VAIISFSRARLLHGAWPIIAAQYEHRTVCINAQRRWEYLPKGLWKSHEQDGDGAVNKFVPGSIGICATALVNYVQFFAKYKDCNEFGNPDCRNRNPFGDTRNR
jgi:hypothetical protein